MAEPRDPLEALGEAWRSLEPPAPADGLADCDPLTRASVEWLRDAWQRLEPQRPVALPARSSPNPWRQAVAPLAVAAAVLAVLAGSAWWGTRPGPEPAPRVADLDPTPFAGSVLPLGAGAGVSHVASDRIELRSGNVRLVLLTGPPAGAADMADDTKAENERSDR